MHFRFRPNTVKLGSIIALFLLLLHGSTFAQTKKELELQRSQLLTEIKETKEALEQIRNKKKASLFQLELLKKQVNAREQLLRSINREIQLLNDNIDASTHAINGLKADLGKLQAEYRKMLRTGYRNRNSYTDFIFVLSAQDFYQAIRRFQYLQAYSKRRQQQVTYIKNAQVALNLRVELLKETLANKQKLGAEEANQKMQLENEQKNKQVLVSTLQQNEQQLKKDLRAKEDARNRLNRAIEDLIRKEIANSNKEKKLIPGKNQAPLELQLTPEAKALGSSFATNKGKLPWPVARGYISETFGEHAHPVLRGIKTTNNGINIRTGTEEPVRTIFAGEVTSAFSVPGMQQVVIVRHGQYLTVYAKLVDVLVKKGQKLNALDPIGTAFTNPDDQKAEIHLEIWNGTTKLDPLPWLLAK